MARPFSGQEHLEAARRLRDEASSAEQLRQALAVLLPLELGLSLGQVAQVLGRSKGGTCSLRTRFIAYQQGRLPATRSKTQLRKFAGFAASERAMDASVPR